MKKRLMFAYGTVPPLLLTMLISLSGCQTPGEASPPTATSRPTPNQTPHEPGSPTADLAGCTGDSPVPSVPKTAKMLSLPNEADDTAAIQSALNELKAGDWLVFQARKYTISKHLEIKSSGITLYGKGAVIHATNPTDGALLIQGDSVAVYDFTLEQDSTSRQSTPWSGGIAVYNNGKPVRGSVIQGNTINSSAAVGIFLFRAHDFSVSDNTIWRSWADGIHMTAGSTDGRVVHNHVSQNGDDMIAVVSTAGSRAPAPAAERYANWQDILQNNLDRNILIYGNDVSDQYWGRGISVVGGSDITIENNSISKTPLAAAIYLSRELSWMTLGDHDILVKDNKISHVQTDEPSYKPPNINIVPTHMPAIEVASEMYGDEASSTVFGAALDISRVAIVGNTVQDARFAGIRMGSGGVGQLQGKSQNGSAVSLTTQPGRVSEVLVENNTLSNIGGKDLIEAHTGLAPNGVACSGNVVNGVSMPKQCGDKLPGSTASFVDVKGASLRCSREGAIIAASGQ